MAPRIPKRNTHFINPETESSRGRSALEAMRGYVGAPSQASVMYPGTQRSYEAGELAGMAEMLIPGASLAKGALGAALAGVIKPRGGNWVPGDVESSISNLLRPTPSPAYDMYGNEVPNILANSPMYRANTSLNRWIEGPLTKYIKRDMATPEDPIRRLAEQGVSHIAIPENRVLPPTYVEEARAAAGFPEGGMSADFRGSFWENLSDGSVHMGPARYLQEDPKLTEKNPWMRNLDPESDVYGIRGSPGPQLGFDHLVDELNNALNPVSGLPRNLLLRPEQVQQMGVEKAVRHVDAINKWREAQRVAADAELANKAMVVREYAENNPKGLRWMELKKEDDILPEGYSVVPDARNSRYWDQPDEHYFHVMSPSGEIVSTGATEKEALGLLNRDQKIKALEKQLKYEGDTMGHCVGGYCPDVLEGRSRIFSLRDAKGEPHVTIEVRPQDDRSLSQGNFSIAQIKGKQNLAPKDEYLPFVQDFVRNSPLGGEWGHVDDLMNTGLSRVGDRYVTLDELNEVPKSEWAEGGLVAQPDYFDDLDAFLRR